MRRQGKLFGLQQMALDHATGKWSQHVHHRKEHLVVVASRQEDSSQEKFPHRHRQTPQIHGVREGLQSQHDFRSPVKARHQIGCQDLVGAGHWHRHWHRCRQSRTFSRIRRASFGLVVCAACTSCSCSCRCSCSRRRRCWFGATSTASSCNNFFCFDRTSKVRQQDRRKIRRDQNVVRFEVGVQDPVPLQMAQGLQELPEVVADGSQRQANALAEFLQDVPQIVGQIGKEQEGVVAKFDGLYVEGGIAVVVAVAIVVVVLRGIVGGVRCCCIGGRGQQEGNDTGVVLEANQEFNFVEGRLGHGFVASNAFDGNLRGQCRRRRRCRTLQDGRKDPLSNDSQDA
mmetsp:Transcript_26801/g.57757  ORF Transcript_26801/g.57757 Transcript_26801/m.57757 type:complete len:342 (-) Transcript_26801:404-1429(-)